MPYLKLEFKLFVKLSFAFLLFTVIGTLSHEIGHIVIAKCLGYTTHLGYGYMNCLEALKSKTDSLLIRIGGPLQTMITGSLGLLLLFKTCNKKNESNSLSFVKWLYLLVALFWLRQLTNLVVAIGILLMNHRVNNNDELFIAKHFGLPNFSILIITGLIGLIVLSIIYFKFIPRKARFTFLLAGLVGGVSGYWLWLIKFGPILMP